MRPKRWIDPRFLFHPQKLNNPLGSVRHMKGAWNSARAQLGANQHGWWPITTCSALPKSPDASFYLGAVSHWRLTINPPVGASRMLQNSSNLCDPFIFSLGQALSLRFSFCGPPIPGLGCPSSNYARRVFSSFYLCPFFFKKKRGLWWRRKSKPAPRLVVKSYPKWNMADGGTFIR